MIPWQKATVIFGIAVGLGFGVAVAVADAPPPVGEPAVAPLHAVTPNETQRSSIRTTCVWKRFMGTYLSV
jgi:hypothetical protein